MTPALKAAGSILTIALLAACADAGDEPDTADQQARPPAEAANAEAAEQQATGPDTTAEAVWAFLEREAYRENWRMWPGKDRLYPGTEPHGMLPSPFIRRRPRLHPRRSPPPAPAPPGGLPTPP